MVNAFDRCHLHGEPAGRPSPRTGKAPPQRPAYSDVITGGDAGQRAGEIRIPDCAIDDINRVALRYILLGRAGDRRRRRDGSADDQPEGREVATRAKYSLGRYCGQPSGESDLVSIRATCAGDGRRARLLDPSVLFFASDPISAGILTGRIIADGAAGPGALTPGRHQATTWS
jgi:hypothetical protein